MDDLPYTTPEEDPFHALPPPAFFQLQRRPSSLLDKWIQEQRDELAELPAPVVLERDVSTHAYLAYPDLGPLSLEHRDDAANSLYSYDLVDDDDIPNSTIIAPVQEAPVTPRSNKQQSKPLLTSSPFRNLNLSFRPTSYPIGLTSASDDTTTTPSPRTSARMSIFTRNSRQSTCTLASVNTSPPSKHTRSSSLSTLNMPTPSPTRRTPSSASKWRPSVLGHFSQSSLTSIIPPDIVYTPSRPSLSSGHTHISGTSQTGTSIYSDLPTPSKLSFFESIRTKNRSNVSIFKPQTTHASSSSISSPSRANFDNIGEAGTDCLASNDATLPRRFPFNPKPGGQYDNLLDDDENLEDYVPPPPKRESARSSISFSSSSSFSRVSFGSLSSKHHRKKKRLVISGVGVHETRKFEGVKKWCESFGEIRQITRTANGDLHIDFRRPEVADTVCRVRAKVFITGVGSVYLSWTTGDKR